MPIRELTMVLAAGFAATAQIHSAPPGAAADEPRDVCVRIADVNGWTVVDERTNELRVGVSRRYTVELAPMAESYLLGSYGRIGPTGDNPGYLCESRGRVIADGSGLAHQADRAG